MSILAELLSKVHQPVVKREVAPNLENIVRASSGISAHKNKIIVVSSILIVCVLSGIFFVRYLKSISEQSDVIIASSSSYSVRQDIQEAKLPGNENPGLKQNVIIGAADVPEGDQQGTKPAMKEEVSGVAITEEKALMPDVDIADEDKIDDSRNLQGMPSGVISESGETENTAMNAMEENSINQVNENETLNRPVPVLHNGSRNTYGMDAYLYSAREDEMKGNYSSALMNYKKALELDRNNYAVMNNVAYIFLRLNIIDESIRYSRMAIDINSNYAPALINMGIAYARSGDIASAEGNLSKAFRLEPDNQDVLMNLAILHERQDRLQKASEYFSRLVKLGSIDGSIGLARVYEKQGRIDDAVKLYRSVYDNISADEKVKSGARQRIMVLKNNK